MRLNINRIQLIRKGKNSNGKEVLMKKDHIFPHGKGGKNNISNYQTMCVKCNVAKGSKIL